MRRIILLTFVIAIIFTLISCNTENYAMTEEAMANNVANEITIIESLETASVEVDAIEYDPKKFSTKLGRDFVSFDSSEVSYNKAGEIVVSGFVVNDSDYRTTAIRLRKLELFNEEDELIASNSFGYLYHITLKPEEEIEWTFTFPAINVYVKDDDLDVIKTVSKFTSGY